jgi:hypothetical protein
VPERCSFVRPNKDGHLVKAALDERSARLILGVSFPL